MKPNVILIVIDSLRSDYVGRRADGTTLTPNLDHFASRSLTFENAFAQGPSTPLSVKALLSSTYPYEYGGPNKLLSPQRPMLHSYLREAGYHTAAIVANPYLSASLGWNRDFDHYDDCDRHQVFKKKILFRSINQLTKITKSSLAWPATLPAETLFQRAADWLKTPSKPYFLWIHTMDVHWPYRPQYFTWNPIWQRNHRKDKVMRSRLVSDSPDFTPSEHQELLRQYTDAIRYTDEQLGRFFEKLETCGAFQNTIVVVVADHGEEFGEHGRYFHSPNMYDVLLHVPLIIHLPLELGEGGHRCQEQVRLIDIMPTLLDFADIPCPDFVRGTSMKSIFRGEADPAERPSISEAPSMHGYVLRWREWKYHFNILTGAAKLYNIVQDPDEMLPCTDEYPEIVDRMQYQLDEHIKETSRTRIETTETSSDPQLVERLRELGYME
ncbi:sulfatase-like hydrolase/transferase [Chloroflexi bacterium TSY]|nr:sulfatase-like hydrolase/transferase [Chloroflexi bacterium TSY]